MAGLQFDWFGFDQTVYFGYLHILKLPHTMPVNYKEKSSMEQTGAIPSLLSFY